MKYIIETEEQLNQYERIVTCEECEYWIEGDYTDPDFIVRSVCTLDDSYIERFEDDFCSYGSGK